MKKIIDRFFEHDILINPNDFYGLFGFHTKRKRRKYCMAKMIKKFARTMGFSKKSKMNVSRSFIDFVDSYVQNVDPKNFNF